MVYDFEQDDGLALDDLEVAKPKRNWMEPGMLVLQDDDDQDDEDVLPPSYNKLVIEEKEEKK